VWPWSSATGHCGAATPDPLLQLDLWKQRRSDRTWREYPVAGETPISLQAIRPKKRGPKRQANHTEAQAALAFEIQRFLSPPT